MKKIQNSSLKSIVVASALAILGSYSSQAQTTLINSTFPDTSTLADQGWVDSYSATNPDAQWALTQWTGNSAVGYRNPLNSTPIPYAYLTNTFGTTDFSSHDLTLTFDLGWRYGVANDTTASFEVALVDDAGNGYIFIDRRTTGTKAIGWRKMTAGNYEDGGFSDLGTASSDSTQVAGEMKTLTIGRTTSGEWTISLSGWSGSESLSFTDTTTTTFSTLVLMQRSGANQDLHVTFDNVSLTSIPEPSDFALGAACFSLVAVWAVRRRKR